MFQSLESRRLMAASGVINYDPARLSLDIVGTPKADTIVVAQGEVADPNNFGQSMWLTNIKLNGMSVNVRGQVNNLFVDGGAGNDNVSYTGHDLWRLTETHTYDGYTYTSEIFSAYITSGSGNDTITGLSDGGYVRVDGGAGNDKIWAQRPELGLSERVSTNYSGGEGNDTLYGTDGNDVLEGGAGKDLIYGRAGNDNLYGGMDNDTIYGNDGNDYISGGQGSDSLSGGADDDFFASGAWHYTDYYSQKLIVVDEGKGDKVDGGAGSDTVQIWLGDVTDIYTMPTAKKCEFNVVEIGGKG